MIATGPPSGPASCCGLLMQSAAAETQGLAIGQNVRDVQAQFVTDIGLPEFTPMTALSPHDGFEGVRVVHRAPAALTVEAPSVSRLLRNIVMDLGTSHHNP